MGLKLSVLAGKHIWPDGEAKLWQGPQLPGSSNWIS